MRRWLILLLLVAVPAFGQTTTRTDFQGLAPVRLKKVNGTERTFGLGASTNAIRGTALLSAQSAATSGETIVLSPGTFDLTTNTVLNAVGVNYELQPGASIIRSATTGRRVFYDSAGALTTTVSGAGSVITAAANSNPLGCCIDLRNAGSNFTFIGKELNAFETGSGGEAILGMNGASLTVKLTDRLSSNYDAVIWESTDGVFSFEGDAIHGDDNAIEQGAGNITIRARLVTGGNAALQINSADTDDSFFLVADQLYSTNVNAADAENCALHMDNSSGFCRTEIHCPRIDDYIHVHTSGTIKLTISDATIDSTGNNFASIRCNTSGVGVSGITLSNVTLVTKSSETQSISADGATTITVVGNLTTNKAIDSDVTFTGPGTVIAAGVPVYSGTTKGINGLVKSTTAGVASAAVAGTDYQAPDAELTAIAGTTSAADALPYFTGSGTASTTTLTTAGRNLLDDAAASNMRTTLGLGTIATQSAASVAITGGAIDGVGVGETTPAASIFTQSAIGPIGTATPLTVTGPLLTGTSASQSLAIASTWNTSGNPTAIDLSITNTASGASAKLMNLAVGGVSQMAVSKAGALTLATDLAVTEGGTGASTAAAARGNFSLNTPVYKVIVVAEGTAVTTGDNKFRLPVSADMVGDITAVRMKVGTAGTTGGTTLDIDRLRSGSTVDVLSTNGVIDSAETSTATGTVPVINTSNDDLADGDDLLLNVDGVSTTPPQGLSFEITITRQ